MGNNSKHNFIKHQTCFIKHGLSKIFSQNIFFKHLLSKTSNMLGSSNGSFGSDTISCTAVVGALCGELSPDRTRLVGQAFMSLDTTGSGHVSCTCCTCCTVCQEGAACWSGITALLSGTTVCQELLLVRDYCLSGTTVCQELLFVRNYCFFVRDYFPFCQGLLLTSNVPSLFLVLGIGAHSRCGEKIRRPQTPRSGQWSIECRRDIFFFF
jgi:hypothetical protein